MANAKFSDLSGLTTLADDDLFCVTDDSESSAEKSKKITAKNVLEYMIPIGCIMAWPTDTAPTGWLECNGDAKNTTTYADLYGVIGYTYGGSGANFNLPDLRGRFVRGWDNSAGTDPDAASRTDRGDGTTGDNVGTKQADEYESHRHSVSSTSGSWSGSSGVGQGALINGNTGYQGGNETRPININMMWIIKY